MKAKSLLLLMVVIIFFLSGCATTANYEKKLNSWVGSSVDRLIMSWGPPSSSYSLGDGSQVIEYLHARNVTIPLTTTSPTTTQHFGTIGSTFYSGFSTGSQATTTYYNFHQYCKTRFTISPDGIIKNWGWEGNHCVSN